jgi:hypothetical protein
MPRVARVGAVWLAQAAILLLLLGCPAIPTFDPASYQNAVQVKFETLALIDKSGDKFAAHKVEADALLAKYDGAFENANRVQKNPAIAQAWQVIRGPKSGSAAEYFQTWMQRGSMRPVIRAEKTAAIARHLDYVVCLEAARQGGPTCSNPLGAVPAAPSIPPAEAPEEVQQ